MLPFPAARFPGRPSNQFLEAVQIGYLTYYACLLYISIVLET